MSLPELHVYLDVNVYLDASIEWATDDQTLQVDFDNDWSCTGNPAQVLLVAIESGHPVNGHRMVLHTSKRCLRFVYDKLQTEYKWDVEATKQFLSLIVQIVRKSGGGRNHEGQPLIDVSDDVEDNHRFSEAAAAGCEVLFTSDRGLLAANDARRRPLITSPRDFLERLQNQP